MAYVGPIVWEHLPSYVMDPSSGACTMTGVTSSTRYQATLPRWISPSKVPAELLAWWRAVLRHIGQHESGHTRIFARYVRALPSRVVGQPCSKWQAKVTAWSADLARAQANFDAAEARWVFPKYIGPKNW
jgi:predicted secreted Zn-dependent protease